MGIVTYYALKSALCLAVLYLPFSLLLGRETFFAFNRKLLLLIVGLSLLVPFLNVSLWGLSFDSLLVQHRQAFIEVGMPVAVIDVPAVSQGTHAPSSDGWGWVHLIVYTYIIGLVVCLIRKGWQLYRLLRFIPRGCLWIDRHDDVTIYCHAGEQGAFSWMQSIVVGEADSALDSPVMMHEMAHVRHHHSWDALFITIVEALQWFNPCIWMLDASLREIHEYEADDAVLRSGISAQSYLLLLIKNAVVGSRYAFVNAFNHHLLKKRITMMKKKKSSKWARIRPLYLLPATLFVLEVFASHHFVEYTTPLNSESFFAFTEPDQEKESDYENVRIGEAVDDNEIQVEEKMVDSGQVIENDLKEKSDYERDSSMLAVSLPSAPVSLSDTEESNYVVADVPPHFPGGMDALLRFLDQHVRYPDIAVKNGVDGTYVVDMFVSAEGKITHARIIRKPEGESLSEVTAVNSHNEAESDALKKRIDEARGREALEEEALRVVRSMPDWEPGMKNGVPVNSHYCLPIRFRL